MIELSFPPAVILILGAFLIAVARPAIRPVIVLLAPILTLWAIWRLPDGVLLTTQFLGYPIELVEAGKLQRLFATVFAIMAFAGGLFGLRQARWTEVSAGYAYAAGAVGVSFAGDLITMFMFWEFMAIFSTVVVWCGGTDAARRAGVRYALMHLVGGVVLKIGIEGIMVHTGSIEIRPLDLDTVDAWIVLVGVLINAAAPPVSAWLSDAYPEASPFGSVFLSAFTTKTAVLALILLFPGAEILVWIGLYMIFYGIIYALLENDMRRILAYSIVNQVGFMVCGVGHWHRDGDQRRCRARLRPHHLQGAAVHERGRGALPDRAAQVHRPRRPLPVHAASRPPAASSARSPSRPSRSPRASSPSR